MSTSTLFGPYKPRSRKLVLVESDVSSQVMAVVKGDKGFDIQSYDFKSANLKSKKEFTGVSNEDMMLSSFVRVKDNEVWRIGGSRTSDGAEVKIFHMGSSKVDNGPPLVHAKLHPFLIFSCGRLIAIPYFLEKPVDENPIIDPKIEYLDFNINHRSWFPLRKSLELFPLDSEEDGYIIPTAISYAANESFLFLSLDGGLGRKLGSFACPLVPCDGKKWISSISSLPFIYGAVLVSDSDSDLFCGFPIDYEREFPHISLFRLEWLPDGTFTFLESVTIPRYPSQASPFICSPLLQTYLRPFIKIVENKLICVIQAAYEGSKHYPGFQTHYLGIDCIRFDVQTKTKHRKLGSGGKHGSEIILDTTFLWHKSYARHNDYIDLVV